ncbi:6893_t:CDS:2 [Paraglomus brasilianum]|uniref:Kinetochore protein SPC25 n=1 Tax=Paraglomus brasilianum TaxID=144538 RepID=A0A9N9BZC4_9GLOM|nr:6893_t:CDS:2 [Paraglomus brasilianum]
MSTPQRFYNRTPGPIPVARLPTDDNDSSPPLLAPITLDYEKFLDDNNKCREKIEACINLAKKNLQIKKQKWINGIHTFEEERQRNMRELESALKAGSNLEEILKKEQEEMDDIKRDVSLSQNQYQLLMDRKESIQKQVADMEEEVRKAREASNARLQWLQKQSVKNEPELKLYQEKSAMEMRAVREDVMAFIFTCINDRDPTRQYSFTLDCSEHQYKVLACPLSSDVYNQLVTELNITRDLYAFIKRMRKAFREVHNKS